MKRHFRWGCVHFPSSMKNAVSVDGDIPAHRNLALIKT